MYIGSAVNFHSRWSSHRHLLNKRQHHNKYLQNAWAKYGAESFIFKKLLVCANEDLIYYEQLLIDGYGVTNRGVGYNAAPKAGSMLGYKHSDEAKKKIKEKRAGQVFTEATRALWSANRTGRKMPAWFGEFIRNQRIGSKHTPEARAKISSAGVGRPQSVATREKRGKISAETVKAIRSELQKDGVTQAALAVKYGVHQSTISLINSGLRWNIAL